MFPLTHGSPWEKTAHRHPLTPTPYQVFSSSGEVSPDSSTLAGRQSRIYPWLSSEVIPRTDHRPSTWARKHVDYSRAIPLRLGSGLLSLLSLQSRVTCTLLTATAPSLGHPRAPGGVVVLFQRNGEPDVSGPRHQKFTLKARGQG